MMKYVSWLDQVSKDDVPLVGGKAANLGEMFGLGLPVPSGFVVTTKAFDRLMEINNLGVEIDRIVSETDVEDTGALMEASRRIKELIASQDVPMDIRKELLDSYESLSYSDKITDQRLVSLISAGRALSSVAVRSSATTEDLPTASFAGQQASFLNVKGKNDVVESVKKCWASLFEPRAIFYRTKHGFGKASIAVVIQRMVNADKSGVMFTVDPVRGGNDIVIESTWGLGEYLVLGEVTPDHYVVDKDTGEVKDVKVGKKPVALMRDNMTDKSVPVNIPRDKVEARTLNDDELQRLARYGKQLEEYYGHPQDVEFAVERSTIRIVQTRAITTKADEKEVTMHGTELLRGMGASPGVATGKVKIVSGANDIAKIEEGDILVTTMTSPDLVPTMSKSAAIVTDLGGPTSHAAIVSREMGIPAVVGTEIGSKTLFDGQLVTVDAYNGVVYEGEVSVDEPAAQPAAPSGPTKTKVKVNMAFAQNLEVAEKADGVGLLRIEHMVTKSGVHPAKLVRDGRSEEYIKILTNGIRPIAQAFGDKPVWVRSLDARSDEFRNLEGGDEEPHEANPMLGWHGIRRSLDEPGILKAELEAVRRMRAEGLTNIRVMLPFVISVDEVRRAKEMAAEAGMGEGFQLGIMVETPAAAVSIKDFCEEGVGFVSFGTNDLTQLALGVDRNNEKIASLHSARHPAVVKMMTDVIAACSLYNIETSICGEAGSDPETVRTLVRAGIGSVSCNIDAIDAVRAAVSGAEDGTEVTKSGEPAEGAFDMFG